MLGPFFLTICISLYLFAAVAKNVPKLFLLGPMKSGSSSLHEFLIQHPAICPGTHKEINFLHKNSNFPHKPQKQVDKKVRARYESNFVDARCDKKGMYLDATPQFHWIDKVLPRFRQIFTAKEMSQLKFIVVMREPVSRALSYYNMYTMIALAEHKRFKDIQTFKERDATDEFTFSDAASLNLFLRVFRRDQLLILAADNLFKKSKETMSVISAFLNISVSLSWYIYVLVN